jgi:signal transduction histidine kinase
VGPFAVDIRPNDSINTASQTDVSNLTHSPPSTDEVVDGAVRDGGIQARLAREVRRALIDPSSKADPTEVVGRGSDRVATFGPVIMSMRLATTVVSILLVSPYVVAGDPTVIITALVIALYALFRAFRPIRYTNDLSSLLQVLAEVAIHVAAVNLTGYWNSPLIFSLITAVCIAGFARGFGFALRVGIATDLAVSLPAIMRTPPAERDLKQLATWSVMILLVSIVAGFGRRLSGEADRERDLALDRLSRLSDANALLYSLHRIAQSLPQSLDMNEVLDSTVQRLRGLIDFDTLVIIVFDDTDGHWAVMRRDGCTIPSRLSTMELPSGPRSAITTAQLVSMPALTGPDNLGFDDRSGSGIYCPLSARGSITGIIALEHREPSRFDHRAGGLLSGFVQPLSLALDNAKWFSRLRTVGADEERTRIARDLHDRIGQSLAYLAFELDRIVSKDKSGASVSEPLERLRDDVRGVIREVRDTLYDLRTDVSEDQSLVETLMQYTQRVTDRTQLQFQVDADGSQRLPILQEREMWRITQEAITNVERHAKATRVRITWRCDGERAAIRVTDNGMGFEAGRAGRLDSYGMLGMRERASSIAATLDIHSVPGQGTSITCVLDPAVERHSSPGEHAPKPQSTSADPTGRVLTTSGGVTT